MNMKMLHLAVVLVLLLLAPILADEVPKTVASVYPSICAGALRDAVLSDLGDGVIAECEDIKVTLKDIEDEIARSPEHMREQVRKYQVHVLEQAVIERLIAKEALDWAKKSGKSTAGEGGSECLRVVTNAKGGCDRCGGARVLRGARQHVWRSTVRADQGCNRQRRP